MPLMAGRLIDPIYYNTFTTNSTALTSGEDLEWETHYSPMTNAATVTTNYSYTTATNSSAIYITGWTNVSDILVQRNRLTPVTLVSRMIDASRLHRDRPEPELRTRIPLPQDPTVRFGPELDDVVTHPMTYDYQVLDVTTHREVRVGMDNSMEAIRNAVREIEQYPRLSAAEAVQHLTDNDRYLRETAAQDAIRREERAQAEARAEVLLLASLTPEQQEEYKKQNRITVISQSKKVYVIKKGRACNIQQLDAKGIPILQLCAHPGEAVPDADTVLVQKLMLELDEDRFLSIANKTVIRH